MTERQVQLEVRENIAKSVLYKIDIPKLPFKWGANPYRGCQHDCWYCYARASHEYLQLPMNQFQHIVLAKLNAPEILRKELAKKSWKREYVNMGTVTDPYQPIERQHRITRGMMEAFLEAKTPVCLTTKSHHIQDDLGLLGDFAKEVHLNVVMTVTSMDETLTRQLEPTTCTVKKRFETMEKLVKAGVTVAVLMSPIFPSLTDTREQMEAVAQAAGDVGVSYLLADILSMRSSARDYFLPYLDEIHPELTAEYKALYGRDYPPQSKRKAVKEMQFEMAEKYGINHYNRMVPPKETVDHQMNLDV